MLKKLGIGCGGLILIIVILSVVASGNKPTTTVQTSGTTNSTSAPAQAKVGDKVSSGNWEYTVTKVEKAKTIKWSDFNNTTDAKGQWLIVSITLKNIGNSNFPINGTDFQLLDSGGVKYDPSTELGAYSFVSYQKLTPLGSQFPPGVEVKSAILFDINPAATALKLVLKQANNSSIALE